MTANARFVTAALVLACASPSCARNGEVVISRSASYMGTVVTLTVVASDEPAGGRAFERAFAEVGRLEQLLSSYRRDSDLSRLNAQAGTGPVRVAPELTDVADAAAKVARQTSGAFNPLMGPVVKLWGIPQDPHVPPPEALEALRPLIDLRGLAVRLEEGTISLSRPGMALGLGGIAKGYTADRVVGLLRAAGIGNGVVEIGGDVRAFGRRPGGRPWRIGVRNPRGTGEPLMTIEVRDRAVSTSGDYERFFEVDGVRYHHVLDPKTLMPAQGLISVTILARHAVDADALATAVLVMGPDEGPAFVERTDGVEALMIDREERIVASKGWPGAAGP